MKITKTLVGLLSRIKLLDAHLKLIKLFLLIVFFFKDDEAESAECFSVGV